MLFMRAGHANHPNSRGSHPQSAASKRASATVSEVRSRRNFRSPPPEGEAYLPLLTNTSDTFHTRHLGVLLLVVLDALLRDAKARESALRRSGRVRTEDRAREAYGHELLGVEEGQSMALMQQAGVGSAPSCERSSSRWSAGRGSARRRGGQGAAKDAPTRFGGG